MTAAIECQALVKRYPDITAVDGIDLVVSPGECMAVLGPNGAGKTTTVEMIEGLTEATSGTITIFGDRWGAAAASDQRIRSSIGVALQETHFQERLTVSETVDLFASFFHEARSTAELVALVGLDQKADGRVGKLSGGQRQRLALACALVGKPRLICLDEPTTGLDPQSRRQIWDIVTRFKQDGGTVLLTTHYMEEAAQLADRVAIMNRGKIIALDTPRALVASLAAEDIIVFSSDREFTNDRLQTLPAVSGVKVDGLQVRLQSKAAAETLPALFAAASAENIRVVTLGTHQATLEDVFVHHTGRGLQD